MYLLKHSAKEEYESTRKNKSKSNTEVFGFLFCRLNSIKTIIGGVERGNLIWWCGELVGYDFIGAQWKMNTSRNVWKNE